MGEDKVKGFQIRGVIKREGTEQFAEWNEDWKANLKKLIERTTNEKLKEMRENAEIEISSLTEV
jgi:acetone carboxylase gamma subunit